jgi:NADH:ubiquinone oxidoreductase subunit E
VEKKLVEICLGTSCHLLGSHDLVLALEQLPPEMKNTIEVIGVTCLKGCGPGPSVRINGVLHHAVTPDRLCELIVV